MYIPQPSHDPTDDAARLIFHFDWEQMGDLINFADRQNDPFAIENGETGIENWEQHEAAHFARTVMREPENGDLWTLAAAVAAAQPTLPRRT